MDSKGKRIFAAVMAVFLALSILVPLSLIHILLNKPQGVVCATQDAALPTVIDLVPQQLDVYKRQHRSSSPAGKKEPAGERLRQNWPVPSGRPLMLSRNF